MFTLKNADAVLFYGTWKTLRNLRSLWARKLHGMRYHMLIHWSSDSSESLLERPWWAGSFIGWWKLDSYMNTQDLFLTIPCIALRMIISMIALHIKKYKYILTYRQVITSCKKMWKPARGQGDLRSVCHWLFFLKEVGISAWNSSFVQLYENHQELIRFTP